MVFRKSMIAFTGRPPPLSLSDQDNATRGEHPCKQSLASARPGPGQSRCAPFGRCLWWPPTDRRGGHCMEIKRVGVIGAGQMGNGIAHVFALAGFDVALNDVSESALEAAPGIIRGNMDRQVARDRITEAE